MAGIDLEHSVVIGVPDPGAAQSRQRRRRRRQSFAGVLCTLLFVGFVALFFSMLALLSPPEVTLYHATVTHFHPSPGSRLISADFDLTFSVRNFDSDTTIHHESVRAVVYSGDTPIADVQLPSFHLPAESRTFLRVRPAARADLMKSSAMKGIVSKGDGSGYRTVKLDIELSARLGCKPWNWLGRLKGRSYMVCRDVQVSFPDKTRTRTRVTTGFMVGPPRKCTSNVFLR